MDECHEGSTKLEKNTPQVLARERRRRNFTNGNIRKFLQSSLGPAAPPVTIRSAIVHGDPGSYYTEQKHEVQQELTTLLDTWIPPTERTERPRYLDSLRPEDADDLPRFAKEWILPDIERGGRFKSYWEAQMHGNITPTQQSGKRESIKC